MQTVKRGPVDVPVSAVDMDCDLRQTKLGARMCLDRFVEDGDEVVILGGGRGVTPVYACMVGASKVIAYEAAKDRVELVRQVAELNGFEDEIESKHAIVGELGDVDFYIGDADIIDPVDLPGCDTIEMDIEGAELSVLKNMSPCSENIIVESHGMNGAPPREVRRRMNDLGYRIVTETVPNPWKERKAEQLGHKTIGGVLDEG